MDSFHDVKCIGLNEMELLHLFNGFIENNAIQVRREVVRNKCYYADYTLLSLNLF